MGWVGCLTGLSTTGVRCCCCPKNQGWALSFQIQQCHIMLRGHHVTLHHTISRYTLCQHTQLHFNKLNTASNKPRVLQIRTWEAIRGCWAPRSSFHMLNLFPICKFAAFITWQFSSKIVYWQISSNSILGWRSMQRSVWCQIYAAEVCFQGVWSGMEDARAQPVPPEEQQWNICEVFHVDMRNYWKLSNS